MAENGRQMRFTEAEQDLMKATFKDNEPLLKLLRKVFLPEIDPDAPLGQLVDLWMTIPVKEMDPQTAQINILARNQLIQHVESQLVQIKVLVDKEEETKEEKAERQAKDSTK